MTREPIKLLLVEDEQAHAELIEIAVASSDLNPTLTNMSSGAEALSTLQEESFDLVLLDYSLPGQDGLELLPQIIEMGCAVIMITGKGNEEVAVEAMKRGAVDYLVKSPETFDLLPTIIERSLKAIQAEKALHESEERFRLLLDSTGEAIYGLDLEGNCTFCNPACLRLLGYDDVGNLLGKNMHELMHHTRPDGTLYPEEECRISQAFRQGEGIHVDDEVLWRAAGTSFPAEYRSFPIRRDGELIGSVVTFVDITERKQAERRSSGRPTKGSRRRIQAWSVPRSSSSGPRNWRPLEGSPPGFPTRY